MSQDSDNERFNNLTRQRNAPSGRIQERRPSSQIDGHTASGEGAAAKQKRIACIICRKRKLKCNGDRPTCGTCERLGHRCAYDDVRKKSGPKRGYVKELEARLVHVETELRSKERKASLATSPKTMPGLNLLSNPGFRPVEEPGRLGQDNFNDLLHPTASYHDGIPPISDAQSAAIDDIDLGFGDSKTWEMMGLGLEEPLPPQEAIDELTQLYFEKMHPSVPMIHKYRYLASMNLAPHMRPPICLRYAMWCLASSVSSKYFSCQDMFYQRSRKYAEIDEMKGHGESYITIGHSQCWVLISTYEYKMMYFPRAWQSVGRAIRLAQMTGLHRLDGVGLAVKQALAAPRDWTDREERRRTFWMAYCADRYASIGTGWPMVVDDRDILTNLPATEEAYERSFEQHTCSLTDAMTAEGAASLSSFAGVVLMACLFGRNLTHLHRPDPNDREDDIKGEFWKRHRNMDNILLNTKIHLPSQLELPAAIRDANVVFLHMNIHTSSICLHQAAVFKAEKHRLSPDLINQSKSRCLLAAQEVASIMRLVSNVELAGMHPFLAFCLYVAARVFVQALKRLPNDHEIRTSLEFLLNSMHAFKRKQHITESFLVQLAVDLESAGLNIPVQSPTSLGSGMSDHSTTIGVPVIDIREPAPLPVRLSGPEASSRPVPVRSVSGPQPCYNLQGSATQYSLPIFDPVGFNQELPKQFNRDSQRLPYQGHELLVGQGWNSKHPPGLEGDQLQNNQYDIEMSDRGSDRHQSYAPSHASNFSHRSSSNTSYSPTNDPDHNVDNSHGAPPSSKIGMGNFFQPSLPYVGYSTPSNVQFSASLPRREVHDNYVVPPGWELGNSGVGQNHTTAIQLADNNWSQLLQGMEWDGSSMIGTEATRNAYSSFNQE